MHQRSILLLDGKKTMMSDHSEDIYFHNYDRRNIHNILIHLQKM